MKLAKKRLSHIKTNIITGFLGVGKTTLIRDLIENRNGDERWAVLVNEFGEMGIDGHFLNSKQDSITIKQVPGGCICCAAGLPLQVAVNQLLKQARPERLLIEPSGMGHPRKILKSLTEINYKDVLDMRACLCLLDPRKLQDHRYLQSELFVDQINVADVVIANKTQLCSDKERVLFEGLFNKQADNKRSVWKESDTDLYQLLDINHSEQLVSVNSSLNGVLESSMHKVTLDFNLEQSFSYNAVKKLISSIDAERIKGILNTNKGGLVVNIADGAGRFDIVQNNSINRLEIISSNTLNKEELVNKFKSRLSVC